MEWMAILALIGKILSVIGGFALLATQTPNSSKNGALDKLLQCINMAGANAGKATNR